MPITYEPAQPLAPQVAAAYGAAQENDRFAPQIAQAYAMRQAGDARAAAAYQAAVDSTNRLTAAAGEIMGREDMQASQQKFLTNESAFARTHQNSMLSAEIQQRALAQQAGVQAQSRLQAEHAQQVVQIQQSQLSSGERLRMQRLQQGISYIDQSLATGDITPQEAARAKMQIRTGLDPLQLRNAATRQQHDELQVKNAEQQLAWQTKQRQQVAEFQAKTFEQRMSTIIDPEARTQIENEIGLDKLQALRASGGSAAADALITREAKRRGAFLRFYEESPGNWKMVPQAKETTEGRQAPEKLPLGAMSHQQYQAAVQRVAEKTDKAVTAQIEANPDDADKWDITHRQEALRNDLARMGLQPTYQQYLQSFPDYQPQARGQMAQNFPSGQSDHLGNQQQFGHEKGEGAPTQQPRPVQQQLPQPKPFNPNDTKTQTGLQPFQNNEADAQMADINERTDLSPDIKQAAIYNIERSRKILAARGSFEAMTDAEKRLFLISAKFLASLPPAPPSKTPANQPEPQPVPPAKTWWQRNRPDFDFVSPGN